MALSRSLDSRVSAVSLASAGDSSLACCKVMAWWRRSMVGVFGRGEFVVQLIITDARLARSRAIHLSGTRLLLAGLGLSLCLVLVAAALYPWVFLQRARGLADHRLAGASGGPGRVCRARSLHAGQSGCHGAARGGNAGPDGATGIAGRARSGSGRHGAGRYPESRRRARRGAGGRARSVDRAVAGHAG